MTLGEPMSSNQARELPEPDSVTAELIAIYQFPEFSSEPRRPGMPSRSLFLSVSVSAKLASASPHHFQLMTLMSDPTVLSGSSQRRRDPRY